MSTPLDEACPYCASPYKPHAVFCSACGQPRPQPEPPRDLRFALALYFALLAANLCTQIYTRLGGAVFPAVVAGSVAFIVVAVGFALARWGLVAPLYRTMGFGVRGFAAITLAAPVMLALVLGYVTGIERLFSLKFPDELGFLLPHGLAWTLALVVIVPALVEELAFRGLMFSTLARTLSVTESLVISSLAFALLHLALASLVTHLPLGLYFCWLRHRSGSIWPGVYAHAVHNLCIVLLALH